jgi:hypothetical protein
MEESRRSQYQRVSIKYSVICATLGLAMALLLVFQIFGARGIGEMFGSYEYQASTIIALITLYAAALILGKVAGGLIHRVGVHGPRVWIIGVALAWSCLIFAVIIGSSINFFTEIYKEPSVADAFMDWVFKPTFWVLLFGVLPALGLGLLYAAGMRKSLGRR